MILALLASVDVSIHRIRQELHSHVHSQHGLELVRCTLVELAKKGPHHGSDCTNESKGDLDCRREPG
jgi:hypothetical protein